MRILEAKIIRMMLFKGGGIKGARETGCLAGIVLRRTMCINDAV